MGLPYASLQATPQFKRYVSEIMKIILWISNIISIALISGAGLYWARYFKSPNDPLRQELLIVVALCLIYGFWPALLSEVLAIYKRHDLNKYEKIISLILLPVVVLLYLGFRFIKT